MKSVYRMFILISLFYAVQSVCFAEDLTITLPDGTQKKVESRPIYTSPYPADNLRDAIAAKDLDKLKEFLGKGVSINSAGSAGQLPIMEAFDDDKAEILDFLLTHGADVNLSATVAGMEMTSLDVAVTNGRVAAVKKLLEHGAQTEKELMFKETTLFSAVKNGNPEIIQALVDHGADPNHKDMMGDTPLSLAEKSGKNDIIAILKKAKSR